MPPLGEIGSSADGNSFVAGPETVKFQPENVVSWSPDEATRNFMTEQNLRDTMLVDAMVAVEAAKVDIVDFASDPLNAADLATAFDGMTVEGRAAKPGADLAMDKLLDVIKDLGNPRKENDFVTPTVATGVHYDNLEDADPDEWVLPPNVDGVFIPYDAAKPTNAETNPIGGIIVLSEDMIERGDADEIADVALEELGEALGVFAAGDEIGVDVAGGDVGARVVKVRDELELTDADFVEVESDEEVTNADRVTVVRDGVDYEALAAATDGSVVIGWKDLVAADSDQVFSEGVTLLTDYLFDGAAADGGVGGEGGNIWASDLHAMLNTLPGTNTSLDRVQQLVENWSTNEDKRTLDKDTLFQAIDVGGIRFATDETGAVKQASIDLDAVAADTSETAPENTNYMERMEVGDDGIVLLDGAPVPAIGGAQTAGSDGTDLSPEEFVTQSNMGMSVTMTAIAGFNTETYSPDGGNGWQNYVGSASDLLLNGVTYMGSIFNGLNSVAINSELMIEAVDAEVAAGDLTAAEGEDKKDNLLDQMLGSAANSYNSAMGTLNTDAATTFEDQGDVIAAAQDHMTIGIDKLTGLMDTVVTAVPEMQNAEEMDQLMNSIALAGAVMVTLGTGAGALLSGFKQGTLASDAALRAANPDMVDPATIIGDINSIMIGAGVLLGTSTQSANANDFADFGGISALEGAMGSSWQDLIDDNPDGLFAESSLDYASSSVEYDYMLLENFPDEWQNIGYDVTSESGALMGRTINSSLADAGSYGEINGMIQALRAEVYQLNENATGVTYVLVEPEVRGGNANQGGATDLYYQEGDVLAVRAIVDPVMAGGSQADEVQNMTTSMNVDHY